MESMDMSLDMDDDVFLEVSHPCGLTMSGATGAAPHQRRRSSLFEVPLHRPAPTGSSHMSFAVEPRLDEEGLFQARQRKIQYENTYRLEPPTKLNPDKVKNIIQEVLDEHLTGIRYDCVECSTMCKTIAQEIKVKVKELDLPRYKLISLATIGEKKDQDVRVGSRCVWDTQWDSFATATFQNPHIYAVATVYALYYE